LTAALLARPLTLLTSSELRKWRDELLAVMKSASAHRLLVCIRAACNLAAAADPQRIRSRAPWTIGLASPPRPGNPRNVVLSDFDVSRFVAAAYERDEALGLFVDVMSVIGSRPSQLARLTVADLLAHPASPKLMVPKSAKGKHGATKRNERTSVPITPQLAVALKKVANGRAANEPLLLQAAGTPWGERPSLAYDTAVTGIIAALKLGKGTTLYALRHSSITRALLRGVPIALVAKLHDTSVYQIEKTYAAHISRHGDDVARMALLRHETPADGNVVPLAS
jgi:integrase